MKRRSIKIHAKRRVGGSDDVIQRDTLWRREQEREERRRLNGEDASKYGERRQRIYSARRRRARKRGNHNYE